MFTLQTLSVLSFGPCVAEAELSGAAVVLMVVEDGAPPGAGEVRWRR